MLTVKIKNFRKWEDVSFDIPLKGITLLKGSSGSGKSTILSAIHWALFGTLRRISPIGDEKASTEVSLIFPQFRVTRKNKPSQIYCATDQQCWEGAVAQSMINSYFGCEEVWQSSCYIAQGQRNFFLTSSNANRMDFLNSIAFHEEEPSQKMEKLNRLIQERNQTRAEVEKNYQHSLQSFTLYRQNFPDINCEEILSDQEFSQIKLELATDNISPLEKELILVRHLEKDLSAVQDLLAKEQNVSLEPPILSCHGELEKLGLSPDVVKINEHLARTEKLEQLSQELQATEDVSFLEFGEDDLHKTFEKELLYQQQEKIASSQKLPYDEQKIKERILILRDELANQTIYRRYNEREKLRATIKTYGDLSLSETGFTLENLKEAVERELLIEQNMKKAKQIDVEYEPKVLLETKDRWRKVLNGQTQLQINQEIQAIDAKLSSFDAEVKELNDIQDRIALLEKTAHLVNCPNCSTLLSYENDSLTCLSLTAEEILIAREQRGILSYLRNRRDELMKHQEERSRLLVRKSILFFRDIDVPLLSTVEAQRMKEKLAILEHISFFPSLNFTAEQVRSQLREKEKFDELNKLRETIAPYEKENLFSGTIVDENIHRSQLSILERIEFHPMPQPSSAIIRTHLALKQKHARRAELQSEIAALSEKVLPCSKKELSALRDQVKNYHQALAIYQREKDRSDAKMAVFLEQISSLMNKLDKSAKVELEKRLREARLTRAELERKADRHEKAKLLSQLYQTMCSRHQELSMVTRYLAKAEEVKQILVKCQCQLLDDTVNNINNVIGEVSQSLFTDEIVITLELYKTVKSSGIQKPTTNFMINYRGGTFDNVNQLSGGEGDRVSLALTVALNQLSNFPILFLDESLSSLDQDIKNSVIESLRNTDRGIVVVMHDGVEGIFDEVIEL